MARDGEYKKGLNDRSGGMNFDSVRLSVLVLRGGPSAEREVSFASGKAVATALRKAGHTVIEADIAPGDLSALDKHQFEVVFPVLHGTFGEDGALQAILEKRKITYAGSDAVSSCLAMDKYRAKAAFTQAGLQTAESVLIPALNENQGSRQEMGPGIKAALEQIGIPCVVKPNCQGSSVGVVIAQNEDEAGRAIVRSLAEYGDCLIERFIAGRELTVSILDGRALPVLEIRPKQAFYNYQAKYLDDGTEYLFEMGLGERFLQDLQADAEKAFAVLGCRDFGRVDFLMDRRGRTFLLEINTIPGFTDHSLLPKAAARIGITMSQLCDKIVQMAWQRSI
jgi:D-alanine-D-alanine ligase